MMIPQDFGTSRLLTYIHGLINPFFFHPQNIIEVKSNEVRSFQILLVVIPLLYNFFDLKFF